MNIVFTGTHGTGKSTLVSALSKILVGMDIMPNIRRELKTILKVPLNKQTTYAQQYTNAMTHTYFLSKDNYISDRSIIDIYAYTLESDNIGWDELKEFTEIFKDVNKLETVVFYTPIEFPLEADGIRDEDEEYRKEIDNHIRSYLKNNKIEFIELNGEVNERLDVIMSVLKDKGYIDETWRFKSKIA